MHVELTETRLKQMAKTLRADLGSAAPSYQHTLDLLAKMLGHRSYESLKPRLADQAAPPAAPGLAPHGMFAALWVDRHDRPDWVDTEPLILLGNGRGAAEAALHGWLDAVGSNRTIENQPHHIEMLPVHVRTDAGPRPIAAIEEVFVAVVEWGDRPDEGAGPLVTLGQDRQAAEAALARKLGTPAALPPHRVFTLQVHQDPRSGTVGRRGEALPAEPTGQPANLLLANADPVMDGTRLYARPTYYACGICGAMHPADWNGDCRDDNNRFDLEQLDARHGENGWDEIDMPGTPLDEMMTVHPPARGTNVDVIPVLTDTTLIDDAMQRLRDDYRRKAMRYDYVPDAADTAANDGADDDGHAEPRWRLHKLTDRGMTNVMADPSMFPDSAIEQAVPEHVRRALERLHAQLGLERDDPLSVYIDAGRAFAFLGGLPEHLAERTQTAPTIAALHADPDQKDAVMDAAPAALSRLLLEIDRDW